MSPFAFIKHTGRSNGRIHPRVLAWAIRPERSGPGTVQQVQGVDGCEQGHRNVGSQARHSSSSVSGGAFQRLQLCHVSYDLVVADSCMEAMQKV